MGDLLVIGGLDIPPDGAGELCTVKRFSDLGLDSDKIWEKIWAEAKAENLAEKIEDGQWVSDSDWDMTEVYYKATEAYEDHLYELDDEGGGEKPYDCDQSVIFITKHEITVEKGAGTSSSKINETK